MDSNISFVEFSDVLASKAATPGGGGASAAVGALACSLGEMTCNLTVGKEKYAAVEDEVQKLLQELGALRAKLLDLVDEDARAFALVANAYSIPKDDPDREGRMNAALKGACVPPVHIMDAVAEVIDLLAELVHKCSPMVLSDVGVAVTFARAALEGASLNVYVNTASCTDADFSFSMQERTDQLLKEYGVRSAGLFDFIRNNLKG